MIKMDSWTDIKGYEGCYQVNMLGNVRSLDRIINESLYKGKILKPNIGKTRYAQYTLKGKQLLGHRIVLMTFNPREDMKDLEVNHIDGDKLNNALWNLEWCTKSENHLHAHKIGLKGNNLKPIKGSKNGNSKLTEGQVKDIINQRNNKVPRKVLAKKYGVSITTISSITTGRTWNH